MFMMKRGEVEELESRVTLLLSLPGVSRATGPFPSLYRCALVTSASTPLTWCSRTTHTTGTPRARAASTAAMTAAITAGAPGTNRGAEGRQKSFCMSTTRSADRSTAMFLLSVCVWARDVAREKRK
jgi:hypothetical protein